MEKVKEGAVKLSIADLNTVFGWGWDARKLAEELTRLDYELIPGMDAKDEGTAEQWTSVFLKWPQTWRLMVSGASNIVGYWHFVPLKKESFDVAMQGRLLDSEITESMLLPMDRPGYLRYLLGDDGDRKGASGHRSLRGAVRLIPQCSRGAGGEGDIR